MPTNINIFLLILHKDLQLYQLSSLFMEEEEEGAGDIYLLLLQCFLLFYL
jgi:hypothetical protein